METVADPRHVGKTAMSRIVIIEDDDLMRGLLEEWLTEAGYSVSSGTLRDAPAKGKVDLVIVDIFRPRQAGDKVVCAVQAAYPDTPLIAMSGQFRLGLGGASAAAHAFGVRQVISKPFSRDDFLAAVGSVIGRPC
jgi:DNA-binding NtrC family response regulator